MPLIFSAAFRPDILQLATGAEIFGLYFKDLYVGTKLA
jgi:hypothetical protein